MLIQENKNLISEYHNNFKNSKAEELIKSYKIANNEIIEFYKLGYNPQKERLTIFSNSNKNDLISINPTDINNINLNPEETTFNIKAIEPSEIVIITDNTIKALIILENLADNDFNSFENGVITTKIDNYKITSIATDYTYDLNEIKDKYLIFENEDLAKDLITKFYTENKNEKLEYYILPQDAKVENTTEFYDCLINALEEDKNRILALHSEFENLKNLIKNKRTIQPIATQYPKLNNILNGGFISGLYILGAMPSIGKTTFLLNLVNFLCSKNNYCFYFSLEPSREELLYKLISLKSYELDKKNPLSYSEIMFFNNSFLTKKQKENYTNSIKAIANITKDLHINDSIGKTTIKDIELKLKYFIKHTRTKPIVFIDYLQALGTTDTRLNDKQKTDDNITLLKQLSKSLDITIIALSSFNRLAYSQGSSMSSFKESGAIEFGADVLLSLENYDPEKETTNEPCFVDVDKNIRYIKLKVLKNRNGLAYQNLLYDFNAKYNHYKEE